MDLKTLKIYIEKYANYGPVRREFNTCVLEAGRANTIAPIQRILSAGATATKRKYTPTTDAPPDRKKFKIPQWQRNMHKPAESALVTQDHLHKFLPERCERIGFDQVGGVCYITAAVPVIVYMYFDIISIPMKRTLFNLITTTPGYTESKKKAGTIYQTDKLSFAEIDEPFNRVHSEMYRLLLPKKYRDLHAKYKHWAKHAYRVGKKGGSSLVFITAMILHNTENCVVVHYWDESLRTIYPSERFYRDEPLVKDDNIVIKKEISDKPIAGKTFVHIVTIYPHEEDRYTFSNKTLRRISYDFILYVFDQMSHIFSTDQSQILILLRTKRLNKEKIQKHHVTLLQYCKEGAEGTHVILLCNRGECKPLSKHTKNRYFKKGSCITELVVFVPSGHEIEKDEYSASSVSDDSFDSDESTSVDS